MEVKKIVSPSGLLFTNDNWNTDFAVPNHNFKRFTANITPQTSAQYAVKLFFKYNDNTFDKFYDSTSRLEENRPVGK